MTASTGEEEADLDLGDLVRKGEVAWLSAAEMEAAAEAALAAPSLGDTGKPKLSGAAEPSLQAPNV